LLDLSKFRTFDDQRSSIESHLERLMKSKWLTLLVLLALAPALFAQEEPIPPKRTKMAKVGLFGGFTPGWLAMDTKPINAFLVGSGAAALSENGVFMVGGGGAIYIMVLPNFRVGGMAVSGGISSSTVVSNVRKDAELRVNFGGVTVEYVIPIVPRLDLAVGTMIGGGSLNLTLRQDVGGNKTWFQEWSNFGTGNYQTGAQINNVQRTLTGSYYVLVPSVNLEYAVMGWLGVRLGASYVAMFSPTWQLDGKYDLVDVPDKISGKGFMINGGIFLGTY
jgi:hypothetical protein